jgi:hypothetical protein
MYTTGYMANNGCFREEVPGNASNAARRTIYVIAQRTAI